MKKNNNSKGTFTLAQSLFQNAVACYRTGINPLKHLRTLGFETCFRAWSRDCNWNNTGAHHVALETDSQGIDKFILAVDVGGDRYGDWYMVIKIGMDCWAFSTMAPFSIKHDFYHLG